MQASLTRDASSWSDEYVPLGHPDSGVFIVRSQKLDVLIPLGHPWLATTIVKLVKLAELGENWNGEYALPVQINTVVRILTFLGSLPGQMPEPVVYPNVDGSATLEWRMAGKELGLAFTAVDSVDMYYFDGFDSSEETVPSTDEKLGKYISEIANSCC